LNTAITLMLLLHFKNMPPSGGFSPFLAKVLIFVSEINGIFPFLVESQKSIWEDLPRQWRSDLSDSRLGQQDVAAFLCGVERRRPLSIHLKDAEAKQVYDILCLLVVFANL
jgi:hypothetical protein